MPTAEEAEAIRTQHKELQSLCDSARKIAGLLQKEYLGIEKTDNFDIYANNDYWRSLIYREALIKIANIIERDLRFSGTFSILTSARYLMEMLIWLRLIAGDEDRFISYFIALKISEQTQHTKSLLEQTQLEIDCYNKVGKRQDDDIKRLKNMNNRNFNKILKKYDLPVSRSFLSHEHAARKNGFTSVGSMLEVKVVKQCKEQIAELEKEREKAKLARKYWLTEKWLWNKRAEEADLKLEYNFVYGYVSRLLHCKPASFVINQKNIEYSEVILFGRFILFIIGDIIKIVKPKMAA